MRTAKDDAIVGLISFMERWSHELSATETKDVTNTVLRHLATQLELRAAVFRKITEG